MLRRANLHDVELDYDPEPEGYGAGYRRIGELVEAQETNLNVILLSPRQAVCPYHYEYKEEWLLVLDGEVDHHGRYRALDVDTWRVLDFDVGTQCGAQRVEG